MSLFHSFNSRFIFYPFSGILLTMTSPTNLPLRLCVDGGREIRLEDYTRTNLPNIFSFIAHLLILREGEGGRRREWERKKKKIFFSSFSLSLRFPFILLHVWFYFENSIGNFPTDSVVATENLIWWTSIYIINKVGGGGKVRRGKEGEKREWMEYKIPIKPFPTGGKQKTFFFSWGRKEKSQRYERDYKE